MSTYTNKVMDHFQNPRNIGEVENPDGIGEVGNPVCGDVMRITIKVGKKPHFATYSAKATKVRKASRGANGQEILEDIKFKTFGCAAAIATSSMITEMAIGKTLDEALKITRQDVSDKLGGLPPIKEHCSNLAADALHKAIEDYKNK